MASLHRVAVLASATQTGSGTGAVLDMPTQLGGNSQFLYGVFMLTVSAVAGTLPTLDVFVQMEMPDGVTWNDIVSFARVTGTEKRVASIIPSVVNESAIVDAALALGSVRALPLGARYRVKWVLSGTAGPSFTFAVLADLYD